MNSVDALKVVPDAEISDRRRRIRLVSDDEFLPLSPDGSFQIREHNFAKSFQWLKRMFDIVVAATLLVALAPLLAVVGITIRLTSPGPALFAQTRVGQGGQLFKMLKFRTMVVNAEQLRAELLARNEQKGPVFKMRRDPRVTRLGRVLRRYSLDELPQLINVLLGDMTFVGPRPPIPSEVLQYKVWQARRLSVKPGLTCIWQVSGRSRIDFETWVRMDLKYIDKASPALDMMLLVKTLPAIAKSDGAY